MSEPALPVIDRITEVLGVPAGGLLRLAIQHKQQELPLRVAGVTFSPDGVPITLWVTSTHPEADPQRRIGVPWVSITVLSPEV
jgi:hypothetical protein